jgi:hypothetical protein
MNLARKTLIVCLGAGCAAFLLAQTAFKPAPAAAYPGKMKVGNLIIAAVKYESDEETRQAFGKVNPNEYGVLPVLLLLENTGEPTLLLDRMRVSYMVGSRQAEPMPPADLPYLIAPKRPYMGPKVPVPVPLPQKKNPMGAIELQTRAFGAKTLLKGESASGFFYFQVRHRNDAVIFVTGIREAVTNKELFFAEVPIDTPREK